MVNKNSIKLFGDDKIRAIWDDEQEKWYFSVVDVVAVLTESPNPQTYWRVLKKRLKDEGNETVTNCNGLKMRAADGKMRLTDVADTEQLLRIIQSIPSPKAEPFKAWLAKVGAERLDQMQDPELSIQQAMMDYKRLGYSDNWINQRLKSIEIRKDLTDQWKLHNVEEGVQYASLTDQFMMTSLMESAKTTPGFLLAAGAVMIIAMATSKKAQNVIKTSVDLSRQDEGDEMFGSSSAARVIVRNCQATDSWLKQFMPKALMNWINSRFDKNDVELEESAAFDVVRAAVNLVLASMLITIGTNLKLPLSTTYVTFMVAMGSSLADRAWSRESAVFRVTGVLSVIGGWFITAGVAFAACAIVCIIMHFGGVGIQACFMGLVIYLLIRSNIQYNKKAKEEGKSSTFQLMMRSRDPEIVWDLLRRQVSRTQSYVCHFALNEFNLIMDGLTNENTRDLRHANKDLKKEQDMLKKFRRQEMLGLKKSPIEIAIERNTWFHLGANSNQQFIYSLRRMLDPIKEHVDNNFNPLPAEYIKEFAPVRQKINDLMRMSCELIETGRYDSYREILAEADACKDELSVLRKKHIDRIQHMTDNTLMQISLVYLNVLQESQEFLSVMRHQLRAAKKFMEK